MSPFKREKKNRLMSLQTNIFWRELLKNNISNKEIKLKDGSKVNRNN